MEGQEGEPHSGLWIEIERDPDCLVCGERLRQGVRLLAQEESDKISLEDLAASGLTTDIVFEEGDD